MSKGSILAVLFSASLLGTCGGGGLTSALEASGLRKPAELPDAQKPPRSVALRLHASPRLNLDRRGQPLALAVRLYKLRQKEAFEQTPYDAFLDARQERERLGADLLEVREVMLVPGQKVEMTEKLGRDAGYLAVVALFQRPAEGRWRIAVKAPDAEREGLSIGLHACALTVGAASLSSVRCQ